MSNKKIIYSRLLQAFLVASILCLGSCRIMVNGGGGGRGRDKDNHHKEHKDKDRTYVPQSQYLHSEESGT